MNTHLLKLIILCGILINVAFAQGPEVTSWIINTTGATGYNNIPSNVQQVQYGTANVYVTTTCIPDYSIGPWPGNPNTPSNQNFVFKITRTPIENTGTPTNTGLGHIGVWSNGVSIFNPLDAMSYMNQNVWHQNALYFEGSGFDNCLGHPNQQGEYHHHINPTCLYDDQDSTVHSPIIGYAFDGFPIYGAYGYASPTTPGPLKRMLSSYQERNITTRDTLPNGSAAGNPGPAVGGQFTIGAYVEDYLFTPGSGDLDEHNGRYCVTPEYPGGTYAYFVTLDANLNAVYPYVIGITYYGVVQSGNTGPGSGHNAPSEPVNTYLPTGVDEIISNHINIFPNPVLNEMYITSALIHSSELILTDVAGKEIKTFITTGAEVENYDLSDVPAGIYFLKGKGGGSVIKFIKQ